MDTNFDVIIIGLGAAGSAAAYHLARGNKRVLGIDRFRPPHVFGSSHGESRIIRQAYFESPMYVPFVQAAMGAWLELEQISGEKLFVKSKSLTLGNAASTVIQGVLYSAEQYNLKHQYLDCGQIRQIFPALKPTADTVAVLEEEAGLLLPEACIRTHLDLAARAGAVLHFDEQVMSIKANGSGVDVTTSTGRYGAGQVIVSAGAWVSELLPDLKLPLSVERRVVHWFKNTKADDLRFLPDKLPVYIWEYKPGQMFYGFPDLGNGIKIASTKKGATGNPDQLNRKVDPAEVEALAEIVRNYFNLDAIHAQASVCMYTNTPDEHFIIDRHPFHENIIVASPCSGHGFKFSSMVGQLLSQMASGVDPDIDLQPFRLDRFNS
ncbi:N-methyl-L-tryptophan oxidase [Pedobacter sp. MC2016-24]|uniref:N-methyl-L-tryptophan oxidase n=1 Tax=Pedobacter sp. MC2016-24 TaxID=2780090 RepID=UPI00188124E6|nr:N-methyl-L-tryptophan oxidase [Pedobacter sp. MC2016-24]